MHALYHLFMCEVFQNNGSSAGFFVSNRERLHTCVAAFLLQNKNRFPPSRGPAFVFNWLTSSNFFFTSKSINASFCFVYFFFNIISLSNLEIINYYRTQYERACLHYFSILDSQKMNINLFLRSTMH